MKVLYHIDNEAKWTLVLENVTNMLKYGQEYNESFEIEIVATSTAILGLIQHVSQKSKWYLEMDNLFKQNVVFSACNNAINKLNYKLDDLCSFAKVVPAGVAEIAKKQTEGFVYIKP